MQNNNNILVAQLPPDLPLPQTPNAERITFNENGSFFREWTEVVRGSCQFSEGDSKNGNLTKTNDETNNFPSDDLQITFAMDKQEQLPFFQFQFQCQQQQQQVFEIQNYIQNTQQNQLNKSYGTIEIQQNIEGKQIQGQSNKRQSQKQENNQNTFPQNSQKMDPFGEQQPNSKKRSSEMDRTQSYQSNFQQTLQSTNNVKIVQVKQVNSSSAKYPAVVPLPGNKKNDYKVNKQNDCPMNKQNDCRMSLQQENNNHSQCKNQNNPRRLTAIGGKMMEAQARMKIDKKVWNHVTLKIVQCSVNIDDLMIKINEIQKIKIFPSGEDLPKYNTIKITLKGEEKQQIFVALKRSSKWADLPLPYETFVKVIIKKLKNYGIKNVTNWELPSKKPKRYTVLEKVVQPAKSNSSALDCKGNFSTVYKYETIAVLIHGIIYKKSQFFGKWQKRYTVINQSGILSYRNQNDENPSIKIQRSSIRYIWTWFNVLEELQEQKQLAFKKNKKKQLYREYSYTQMNELFQQNKIRNSSNFYLIVKVKYGFNDQTEFAIPICNFDVTISKNKNWLLAFFKVLPNLGK